MTPTRKRRMIAVLAVVVGVGIATTLAVNAFRSNMLYFISPSDIKTGQVQVQPGTAFRVGGMVMDGSVKRQSGSMKVRFVVTDYAHEVPIEYEGILPDLFREGQGIVAQGKLDENGLFHASQVLAKHDENYMPPEVADALERASGGKHGS